MGFSFQVGTLNVYFFNLLQTLARVFKVFTVHSTYLRTKLQ